jgi:hypothetical protein
LSKARACEWVRESFVVTFNLYKKVCLFYKTSLLTALACELCDIHMPMHIGGLIACIIFLDLKIFVCLIKQARSLAIISKFGGVWR